MKPDSIIAHRHGARPVKRHTRCRLACIARKARKGAVISYIYDPLGRVTRKTQTLHTAATGGASSSHTIAYSYHASRGLLQTITYPAATASATAPVLGLIYNAAGQVSQLTWNGQSLVSNLQYNANGQPTRWVWGFAGMAGANPLSSRNTYDGAGRLVNSNGQMNFIRDSAGRIVQSRQNLRRPDSSNLDATALWDEVTHSIVYDGAGRITALVADAPTASAASNRLDHASSYTYDANGNRTARGMNVGTTTVPSTTAPAAPYTSHTRQTLTYSANRLQTVSQTSQTPSSAAATTASAHSLDQAGYLTFDGTHRYAHNAAGRVFRIDTAAVGSNPATTLLQTHDHTNQRLHKSSSLGHTHFIYDESGHLLAERVNSASGTQIRYHIYLPMGTGLGQSANLESGQGTNLAISLATQDISNMGSAGAVRHYAVQTDHQGSPRQIIDHTRQTQWQWPLSAFGEIPPNTAANKFNAADTAPTPVAGAINLTHNPRYAGQYFDQETNLFDNWHRTYNPQTGRYTQSDPIGLEGGWNRFGYAEGNALSFNDPKGQSVAAGIGALLVGYGAYKLWDKLDKEEKCAKQCMNHCSSIRACGDTERTWLYEQNTMRCYNSCVPVCIAEFAGGPKKGPTKTYPSIPKPSKWSGPQSPQ